MKIDSHQHFWNYTTTDYGWIDETMSGLRKDRLPGDLAPELHSLGFDGTIAVQARQSVAETEWLLSLAQANEWIKGVVGWVDLCSPDVDDALGRYRIHPKFVGVRHVLQDEPDDDFMLRPEFLRGIGRLNAYDLAYDILIFPRHLPNAVSMVRRFPDQRFILDHCAKPYIRDKKIDPWAHEIATLAECHNVYCKLSGLVTEADWHAWRPADFFVYLDSVIHAFGPGRVMIGSDWPVCTVAGTYAEVMGIVMEYIHTLSVTEQTAVLGGTAIAAYHL